ncbi:SusC/RagA family TonB-linked outer membrane protein [Spirosoma foliorum]|uniref:TonB-dependent receptor n=1 Tax=Spirosoma foliorum TaxID=2710596 RepID=A0A7G5GR87_9BACT|nr:TonB-dependent receptor [Spirosoma foliorum]QMW01379.1 TonB-dependent receptor [Spirosoma foliorum]
MMRPLLSYFPVVVLVLLLTSGGLPIQAQYLASARSLNQQPTRPATAVRVLKDVLNEWGLAFGVNILYEESTIEGLTVSMDAVRQNGKLEQRLDNLLRPFRLTYRKRGKSYLITPVKNLDNARSENTSLPSSPSAESVALQPVNDITQIRSVVPVSTTMPALRPITGRITSETGDGLPGVSVVVKGTTIGTATDGNGMYKLNVPDAQAKGTLVFSFIGYETQEVTLGNQTAISLQLQPTANSINEVVVVGYGTQKRENITGAVSTIEAKVLENRPVTNAVSALQGTAPGLIITRTSGQPGQEGWAAQIRGATSINGDAGNSPLVIVDGVEGDLSLINPNDIANISVLKDAAAAAIYGAKAGGGVILVTTKKGSAQKMRIDYTGLFTFNKPYNQPKLLHSWEQAQLNNVAQFNTNGSYAYSDQQIRWLMDPDTNVVKNSSGGYDYYFDTNQLDILTRKVSPVQNHNVSISGGNDKTQYLFSLGYFDQKGVFNVGPDAAQRYNARLNLNTKLSNKLSIDSRVAYTQARVQAPSINAAGDGGLMYNLYQVRASRNPIFLPGSDDTKYAYVGTTSAAYPVLKDGGYNKSMQHTIEGVFTLRADNLAKGLGLRLVYSPRVQQLNSDLFLRTVPRYVLTSPDPVSGGSINTTNSLQKTRATTVAQNVQALGDYDWKIGDKHNFHLLGGFEFKSYNYNYILAKQTALLSNDLPTLNYSTLATASPANVSDNIQVNTWVSYFGRLTYNYAGKYFLEANLRNDASSRLAPGYQSALFPSASAAWRLSTESWFTNSLPIFTEFKLRGSWGQLGGAQSTNPNLYNYDYQAILLSGNNYPFNNANTPYLYQSTLPSLGKGWEIIETTDIGLDFGLFKNRLTGSFDYYVRNNNNVFIRLNLPATLGVTPSSTNAAALQVKGWDASLGWRDTFKNGNYAINLNVSDNTNKVTRYDGPFAYLEGLNPYLPGLPLNTIYGYKDQGYFTSNEDLQSHAFQNTKTGVGDIKLQDVNGDGKVNAGLGRADDHGDLINLGNTSPRYIFGANFSATWKGFDVSALFQGVGERKMLLFAKALIPFTDSWRMPWAIHEDYWTPDNPNARFPRPYVGATWNTNVSDHWVQNAAYIRLKNLQIGYTIPAQLTQKVNIAKARIFFSGQDIWEKNKMWYKYYDAENPSNASFQYPLFRSYSFGLNITFQ